MSEHGLMGYEADIEKFAGYLRTLADSIESGETGLEYTSASVDVDAEEVVRSELILRMCHCSAETIPEIEFKQEDKE